MEEGGLFDDEFKEGEGDSFEEEPPVDPVTLAPDLFEACKNNDLDEVNSLLDQQVPPSERDAETGWGCLHWAAQHGNEQMVKALLEYDVAIDAAMPTKSQSGEDDSKKEADEDGENGEPKLGETSNSGTPLHWAAYNGFLRICWLLLEVGFSRNDVDDLGNTALHLASANGHARIVDCLLRDGANPMARNKYENTPLDLATTGNVRNLLVEAMRDPPPSEQRQEEMHNENLGSYAKVAKKLQTMAEETSLGSERELTKHIQAVQEAIEEATWWAVDDVLISDAKLVKRQLEILRRIRRQMSLVEENSPILTQTQYCNLVNRLEVLLEKATAACIPERDLQAAVGLMQKAHSEYWLQNAVNQLKDLERVSDDDIRAIERLHAIMVKATDAEADSEIVQIAQRLYDRLTTEVEINSSMTEMPQPRLPPGEDEPVPADYWEECDRGHIDENEGFPLPPEETGEYLWIESESLLALRRGVQRLTKALDGAAEKGANAEVIEQAEEALRTAQAAQAQLEAKNERDRDTDIAAATKAAKKLKKKKKKK